MREANQKGFVVVVVSKPRAQTRCENEKPFYPPLEGEGRAPKGRGVGWGEVVESIERARAQFTTSRRTVAAPTSPL